MMYDIYGNATLSIFATSPKGLFFERKDKYGQKPQFREYHMSGERGQDFAIFGTQGKAHHRSYNCLVPYGELFARGWVFQEWLMCRRAIVFDDCEILWSCDHCDTCECRGCVPSRCRIVGQLERSEYRESLRRREQSAALWQTVIRQYSSSNLTFEVDRLPALSGLAKQCRADYATSYIAGCWIDHIVESLLWSGGCQTLAQEYLSPSWSWVAACPGVDFVDCGAMSLIDFVRTDDVSCALATDDPTGRILDGHLSLTGPCVDGTLVPSPDADGLRNAYWVVGDDQQYPIALDCIDKNTLGDTTDIHTVPIVCLLLRAGIRLQTRSFRELGLVLLRTDAEQVCYQRIGLLCLDHRVPVSLADEYPDGWSKQTYRPFPHTQWPKGDWFMDQLWQACAEDPCLQRSPFSKATLRSITII